MNLPKFKNQKLFYQAFTHRSYLNEARARLGQKIESNERLEFLGDSILSFVVSDFLYKKYSEFDEGTLTSLRSLLVNTKSLAAEASKLNFGKFFKLSKGEEESKGRENQTLLANSFEAFIGALFLDQGLEAAYSFVSETVLAKTETILQKKTFKDPKSLLQESVQAQKQKSPTYKVLEEKGPSHAKIFLVGVYVNGVLLGQGNGRSKQEAEENAAIKALEKMNK